MAGLPAPARLLLDRARLSQRGRPVAYRHDWRSPIRCSPGPACSPSAATPGCGTARSSRWCSAPSPASRPSKRHGRPAAAAPVRRGACSRARPVSTSMMAFVLLLLATVLYDGLIGTGEWALARRAPCAAHLPGLGEHGPMLIKSVGLVAFWLLFLGAYLGICGRHEPGRVGQRPPRSRWRAASPSRSCRSPSAAITSPTTWYSCWCRGSTSSRCCPLPVRPRLEPARHRRLSRRHRARGRARCLVHGAGPAIVAGHVFAVYLAQLPGRSAVFRPARAALATQVPLTALMVVYTFIGLSIAAEPIVESRAAAEPAAAASRDGRHPRRCGAARGRQRAPATGRPRPARAAEAHLQGAGLGLSRRHQDERRRSPLCLRLRLSLGCARQRHGGALRSRRRCRHLAPAPRISWACASPASTPRRSRSASATSPSCARSSRSRSIWRSRRKRPNGAPMVAPFLAGAGADGASRRARLGGVLAAEEARRRGVLQLHPVRSKELGGKLAALAAELERDGISAASPGRVRHGGGGAQALGSTPRFPQG